MFMAMDAFDVPASPTQRAICRVIEGLPLGRLATHPEVVASFGGAEAIASLPAAAPKEFSLVSDQRTGKSILAACRALHASQTVDLSPMRPRETARIVVISLHLEMSCVVLEYLKEALQARALRSLLKVSSRYSVTVTTPSGHDVEIVCATPFSTVRLAGRWLAGAIFDGFERMRPAEYADARRACQGRMLPGATILNVSDPWPPGAPAHAPVVDAGNGLVVVVARPEAMNPGFWTKSQLAKKWAADAQALGAKETAS
jgi:hypothetical protein